MKYLLALVLILSSYSISVGQEVYVVNTLPVVPSPVVQTVVYQPPVYTVLVPVVVRPQPVMVQQVIYYPVYSPIAPCWWHKHRVDRY
jgi:hypothetical protein